MFAIVNGRVLTMAGRTFEPALREVDLAGSDTGDQDFAAKG